MNITICQSDHGRINPTGGLICSSRVDRFVHIETQVITCSLAGVNGGCWPLVPGSNIRSIVGIVHDSNSKYPGHRVLIEINKNA